MLKTMSLFFVMTSVVISFNAHAAEEISFPASEICFTNNDRQTRDVYDSGFAIQTTGLATVFCMAPKNINRGMSHAYVRIKPAVYRTGNNRNSCRVDSHHPYGLNYTRPYYGGNVWSNGTNNYQSIVIRPPSNLHKWGHFVISCVLHEGDKIYGVHLVQ